MTQYLISFTDDAMVFTPEELPALVESSLAVVREAEEAGVWVYGAGIDGSPTSVVGTDGSVSDGAHPTSTARLGGFCVVGGGHPRGGARVGDQGRRRLPVRPGGPRPGRRPS